MPNDQTCLQFKVSMLWDASNGGDGLQRLRLKLGDQTPEAKLYC